MNENVANQFEDVAVSYSDFSTKVSELQSCLDKLAEALEKRPGIGKSSQLILTKALLDSSVERFSKRIATMEYHLK